MWDDLPPRRSPPVTARPRPAAVPAPRREAPARGRFPRALAILLLLGFVAAAGAGVCVHRILTLLGGGRDGAPSLAAPPFGGKRKVFVLVLGVDEKNRLRRRDQRRSDTMILAGIDLDEKRVAALSLPRDTRVQIPGHSRHDKLNAAHTYGGAPLVRQTAQELLGIPIDRYVKTDVNGFRAVVDLIGPVDVDIEKRMDYDDNWGNLHIHLKPGRQLLDGEQAMGYVRFRSDAAGDLGRMKRQQKFLRALARKALTPGVLVHLPQVIQRGMEYVETDMSPRELLDLGSVFRDMAPSQIAMATLPGTARYIGRVSYFVLDEERTPDVLQKLFFSAAPAVRADVSVLNGNGLPGIAGEAARRLARAGFQVSRTGNAANYDFERSEIRVTEGHAAEARRVAAALELPEEALVMARAPGGSRPEARVTVVLGKDYRP
ncbi:MAG: LCP family protein [Armatimonadetes bacterium]|nr:LCP family protein [Armatimonadota bacterium]